MSAPELAITCGNGHARVPENQYADGRCKPCKRDRERRRREADPGQTRERHRRWRAANPAHVRQYRTANAEKRAEDQRRARDRLYTQMVAAFGGRCAVPGCGTADGFELDHVDGGGRAHRREVSGGVGGTTFYRWLRRNGWPSDGLQLLCTDHHAEKTAQERRA